MWGTIITIGIQIATSVINQRYNNKNTEKLKQMQRDFRENNLKHALRRDWDRFRSLCNFQVNLETISHKERLDRIDQDFIDSLDRWAHADAISSHYPLRISPYIINKSVIPVNTKEIGKMRSDIFCILTGSNDKIFNQEVLPNIDNNLCDIISTYWNQNSTHTMCYFSNVWNENFVYCKEHIDNLKSIIKTPTITITPYFEKHEKHDGSPYYELVVIINMWGVSSDNCVSYRIKTSYAMNCSKLPIRYSLEEKISMSNAIFQSAICSLAYNIDVYYWTHYYQAPIFPTIVSKGLIKYNDDDILSIYNAYTELYRTFVLGSLENKNDINQESKTLIKDIVEINQFNFPKRCISFLDSITEIPAIIPTQNSNSLIFDSIQSIYKAKTDLDIESFSNIDVKLLDKKDMDLVKDLITISKKYNNVILTKELIDIIKRKILVWDK